MDPPIDDSATCGCDGDHNEYKVQIWDTPGQSTPRIIICRFSKDADIIMFVYDITNRKLFEQLDNFLDMIRDFRSNVELVLVGNNLDLVNDERNLIWNEENKLKNPLREVSYGDGLKYAMKHGMSFYEVSAWSGRNVSNAFETPITRVIAENKQNHFVKKVKKKKWNVPFTNFN